MDETSPAPRIGRINWIGLQTLYVKEVQRFGKVTTQTVIAPVMTSLLFLAIFTLAFGGKARISWEVPFSVFLAPGLVMMQVMQNSFANTASSLLISKVQGNIVDILMPPLSPAEMTIGYVFAGVTRGVVVAIAVGIAMAIFVPLNVHSPATIVYFCVAASLMLSLIGLMAGIWAEKFDHLAAVTNFVIVPLSFLSGTFYSIDRLPELFQTIAHFNPFFYMIDGFRYGFIGQSDSPVWIGVVFLGALDLLLWATCLRLVTVGYKLKA